MNLWGTFQNRTQQKDTLHDQYLWLDTMSPKEMTEEVLARAILVNLTKPSHVEKRPQVTRGTQTLHLDLTHSLCTIRGLCDLTSWSYQRSQWAKVRDERVSRGAVD